MKKSLVTTLMLFTSICILNVNTARSYMFSIQDIKEQNLFEQTLQQLPTYKPFNTNTILDEIDIDFYSQDNHKEETSKLDNIISRTKYIQTIDFDD